MANIVPSVRIELITTCVGVDQNPVAFPEKFAYFHKLRPVMRITGFALSGAEIEPRFSATFEGIGRPRYEVESSLA